MYRVEFLLLAVVLDLTFVWAALEDQQQPQKVSQGFCGKGWLA